MSDNNGGAKMLAGFVLGAAVGGALALLLAPRTGKETREKLSKTAQEFAEAAKEEFAKSTKLNRETGDGGTGA